MIKQLLHSEADKLEKSKLSVVDDIGTVYIGDKHIFRAINAAYIPHVKELLESGLIQELTLQGLFPQTEISNQTIDGYELVLQHEKISRVIYPFEWSPEMLRKAALCVLDVNECANRYGYELKDAHPFNVVFKYAQPMFVDFGSIVRQKNSNMWLARSEFISCYINNLLLVENGFQSLYKNAFHLKGFSSDEIFRINNRLANILGNSISNKIRYFTHYYKNGRLINNSKIESKFKNNFIRMFVKFFLCSDFLPFRKESMSSLKSRLKRISLSHKTMWGNYHSDSKYLINNGDIKLPQRMEWVVGQVKNLPVSTVIELAGNEGVLSRSIAELPHIKEVICTDYDECAVDSLFLNLKKEKIYTSCFDFVNEIHEQILPERFNRFKSDMVIALAVTHHLVLTQQYSIDYIFTTISSFTKNISLLSLCHLVYGMEILHLNYPLGIQKSGLYPICKSII